MALQTMVKADLEDGRRIMTDPDPKATLEVGSRIMTEPDPQATLEDRIKITTDLDKVEVFPQRQRPA